MGYSEVMVGKIYIFNTNRRFPVIFWVTEGSSLCSIEPWAHGAAPARLPEGKVGSAAVIQVCCPHQCSWDNWVWKTLHWNRQLNQIHLSPWIWLSFSNYCWFHEWSRRSHNFQLRISLSFISCGGRIIYGRQHLSGRGFKKSWFIYSWNRCNRVF